MRIIAIVFVVLVVLAIAAAGFVGWVFYGAAPKTSGRVTVEGLNDAVDIVRDGNGVPHVFAKTRDDALFGLGFVHAQDRFWSMHVARRAAAGRLSELFGDATVGTDTYLRTIHLMARAESAYARFTAAERAPLQAYAAGVNAGLRRGGARPIEFTILGLDFDKVEPWRPEDSVSVVKMMARDLAVDAGQEVDRIRILDRLGPVKAAQYMPPYPDRAPIALSASDVGTDPARYRAPRPPAGPSGRINAENGSNNWVVGGAMTTTGAPLLANDPHLGLTAPSVWHLAHLSFGDVDAVGGGIAGIPGIVLGRTRRLAWGFTNHGGDVQDLYRERLDPNDADRYLTPDGSAPFRSREEVLRVKGGDSVTITVRETRHGPVLPKDHPWSRIAEEGEVVALAWTALAPDDTSALAAPSLLDAKTVEDFVAAANKLQDAIQNIVFADVSGRFGYLSPGRIPVRGPDHDTQGFFPARGWLARNDWVRVAGPDETPFVEDPARGYVATANNMIVPEDFPLHFTFDRAWRRAVRIEERLGGEAPIGPDVMRSIQLDALAVGARDILPLMLSATAGDPSLKAARDVLSNWSFEMRREQVAPTLFAAWTDLFQEAISKDDLGPLYGRFHRPRPDFLANVLSGDAEAWCDDADTPERETCGGVLRSSLTAALDRLSEAYGPDLETWTWGRAHPAVHAHTPFENVGPLKGIFSIRTPTDGGYLTVNRGYYRYDGDALYENVHAGGLRALYDLSRPDGAEFMISTGQSGHASSKHYRDLAPLWAEGDYIAPAIDRGTLENEAVRTLTLTPAG